VSGGVEGGEWGVVCNGFGRREDSRALGGWGGGVCGGGGARS